MDTIEKLTEVFKEFPGIGERQAKRFVYFLMSKNSAYTENLLLLVKDLKKEIFRLRYEGYARALQEHKINLEAGLVSLVLPYTVPEGQARNLEPEIEGYRRLRSALPMAIAAGCARRRKSFLSSSSYRRSGRASTTPSTPMGSPP